MACIGNIYHDSSLYGHCLTSVPEQMWDTALGDQPVISLQMESHWEDALTDPPAHFTRARSWAPWFKETSTTTITEADGRLHTLFQAKTFLPLHYIDLGLRQVVMPLCVPVLSLTILPLGFAIKLVHQMGRLIRNRAFS
ncbi:MAG: hypothetical protein K2P51_04315 [Rhabdochlamydiaceae bacterium]|nr:hypothetical protein [Rhabdochlamydiaceae bacterium]